MKILESFGEFVNEKKYTLSDIRSIEWDGTESGNRRSERFYRLYVFDKNNKQIDVRSMSDFNKMFDTNFDERNGYEDFEEAIKTLAPHIAVSLDYYDVS